MSGAKERILARIRAANAAREAVLHPGDFLSWRPASPPLESGTANGDDWVPADRVEAFRAAFESAGGEVVRRGSEAEAAAWLGDFATGYRSVAVGRTLSPDYMTPSRPEVEPRDAALAVSAARGAIVETGSLLLDSRDGRRVQLLAPVHVVVLHADDLHATAREAFLHLAGDLPSAVGLHSGPSKSADIGQVMVKGVHGPGRVVALVIGG